MKPEIDWKTSTAILKEGNPEKIAELTEFFESRMDRNAFSHYAKGATIQGITAASYGDVLIELQARPDNITAQFKYQLLQRFTQRHGLVMYTDVAEMQPNDNVVLTWKSKKQSGRDGYRVMERVDKDWKLRLSLWEHDAGQFEAHEQIRTVTAKDFIVGIRQLVPPAPCRKKHRFFLIKTTEMELQLTGFKKAINDFLIQLSLEDAEFNKKFTNPKKSIDECCKYICQQVRKNSKNLSCVACTDDEVYGLAIHYYDEADLKVEGPDVAVKAVVAPEPKTKEPEAAPASKPCKPRQPRKKTEPAKDENLPDDLVIPLF